MINQYIGFLNTPQLWKSNSIYGLEQLHFQNKTSQLHAIDFPDTRLGKRVEQFVFQELRNHESIEILAENIQVIKDKVTIGELDCILSQNKQVIHLEIVYKFYLYDSSVGTTELERWIGPNRRDSLMMKLNKLKEKQLPILHRSEMKEYLSELQLNPKNIHQKVYFKAQLFVPIQLLENSFSLINNECVKGFYIRKSELRFLNKNQFFIPEKMDWLSDVQLNADWKSYDSFITSLSPFLQHEKSPLCWMIEPNGNFTKFFVVWWE